MRPHPTTITRRELNFLAAGVALTLLCVTALADDPADAVPVEEPGTESADGESTFVPIDNCRLFDTRPEFNVGPRDTPLGPDEVHQQQVTGAIGDCSIPADATAVALNVTIVGPTAPSFLTVYPYAPIPPGASNLNYLPGSPPTPNKVDVKLSPSGQLGFYNLAGTVHVLADATGYYTDATLDGLRADIAALTDRLDAVDAEIERVDAVASSNRRRAFAARVDADGSKNGPGPYTAAKGGLTGLYFVTYDFTGFGIPREQLFNDLDPVIVAAPTGSGCEGFTATAGFVGYTGNPGPDGTIGKAILRIRIFDANGARADCDSQAIFTIEEPNPIVIGPLG